MSLVQNMFSNLQKWSTQEVNVPGWIVLSPRDLCKATLSNVFLVTFINVPGWIVLSPRDLCKATVSNVFLITSEVTKACGELALFHYSILPQHFLYNLNIS